MPASKTVMIVDDEPLLVSALTLRCKQLGLNVRSAYDGLEALAQVKHEPPDILILDINMRGADGLSVRKTLMADPRLARIPVIFLTGRADERAIRDCAAVSARYVLKGPHAWRIIRAFIDEHLGTGAAPTAAGKEPFAVGEPEPPAPPARLPKVLVVDDDRDLIHALEIRLRRAGIDVVSANDGQLAFQLALRERPDAVITDYHMAGGNGGHLVTRIRASASIGELPLIVVSGDTGLAGRDFGFERHLLGGLGANAYLTKPIDYLALLRELSRFIELPPQLGAT